MANVLNVNDIPNGYSVYLPIFVSLLRTLLKVGGGMGLTWALAISDSQLEMAVSAGAIALGALWSAYQKIRAQHALVTAAASPAGSTVPQLPS